MPVDSAPAPVTAAVSAPAAPAAPAPSATPSPSATPAPASTEGQGLEESFDRTFADPDLEQAAPVPDAAPAASAPKPADKPADKPTATPAAPAKPEGEEAFETPQSGTMSQVRAWGRRMGDMAKNFKTKVDTLTAEVERLKTATPTLPPNVAKIQTDYQRLQKEVETYRERITRADYSQSPEYAEKYERPYQEAYVRGRSVTKNLVVRVTNEETGEVATRPGTAEDFDRLYAMTDSEADAAAEAMFGPSARRVIGFRDTAKERAEAAVSAIQQNSGKFAEEGKARQAQIAQQNIALAGLFDRVNTDLQTKHDKWFSEREGDKEWNEALTKGRALAQVRFSDAYAKLSPQERVVLDARLYNRAAAFLPMQSRITKLETDLATANKTIEELRGSGPGKPTLGQPAASTEPADVLDDFDKAKM